MTIATADPLIRHHTKEPLMEEYCVAKQVCRLSSSDMAEISLTLTLTLTLTLILILTLTLILILTLTLTLILTLTLTLPRCGACRRAIWPRLLATACCSPPSTRVSRRTGSVRATESAASRGTTSRGPT